LLLDRLIIGPIIKVGGVDFYGELGARFFAIEFQVTSGGVMTEAKSNISSMETVRIFLREGS
jgi:hypothetical protein